MYRHIAIPVQSVQFSKTSLIKRTFAAGDITDAPPIGGTDNVQTICRKCKKTIVICDGKPCGTR